MNRRKSTAARRSPLIGTGTVVLVKNFGFIY